MAKKTTTPPPKERTVLLIPLTQAREKVYKQLDKGNAISKMEMRNEAEYRQVKAEHRRWSDYTEQLLKQMFNTEEVARKFTGVSGGLLGGGRLPLNKEIEFLREDIQSDLQRLASIYDQLELFPVSPAAARPNHEAVDSSVFSSAPASITINNYGTIHNPQIQQGSSQSSQSIIATGVSDDIKVLLDQLTQEMEKVSKALPEETARQAKQDLAVFVGEVTSKNPRKEWWQLSAEGLKKAATNVGEIGKSVLDLVAKIVAFLIAINKAS